MTVTLPMNLIFQTILTGAVGWAVKLVLDSLKAYRDESVKWRKDVDNRFAELDAKMDDIKDASQATMRTSIIHYCEKYETRGWVTAEELSSLTDMHNKYARLNKDNGFINEMMERVRHLDIHKI